MTAIDTAAAQLPESQESPSGALRSAAPSSPKVVRSPVERRLRSATGAESEAALASEKGRKGTMLFRSTGLGKAELVAEIVEMRRQGDYLIVEMQTTEPVRWRIRGGLSRRDLWTVLKATITPSILGYLLNPFGWLKKDVAHPGKF